MAYGHFSIPPEWYQLKPGNCETSTALFTKLPALRLPRVDWYHSSGTEKCPLAANESWQEEWSLESILAGGRQSSGLWSIAVNGQN